MEEIWKDIPGYSWGYQASNLGRIRSLNYMRSHKIQVLKPKVNAFGYEVVTLWKDGKAVSRQVHRLVADAWLPKSSEENIVNHKNGDKRDNRIANLEWTNYKYNAWHSINVLHRNIKPIKCIETHITYLTATEAARDMKLDPSHISAVCRGKRKSVGGFHFSYLNN